MSFDLAQEDNNLMAQWVFGAFAWSCPQALCLVCVNYRENNRDAIHHGYFGQQILI